MNVAVISGSAGLVGSEAVRFFASKGFTVVGIDNDMRSHFFGENASTRWNQKLLEEEVDGYTHHDLDIRNQKGIDAIFAEYGTDIKLVIHTAAQPSHDWAAKDLFTDFTVNANGTLNILEATRRHSQKAVFIFTSTNKVYGDTPNRLPLIETETRWTLQKEHPSAEYGIDETMSIDQSKHSFFGVSKASADILAQEYGRYFGMKTAIFRCGCLTGPAQTGAELHGFLAYLVYCAISGKPYTVYGHKGKQVRDNIHSADLVKAFYEFYQNPKPGEVYNMGGGPTNSCSVLEAFAITEDVTGKKSDFTISGENRIGDHIWYISDIRKFKSHYPKWNVTTSIEGIIEEIAQAVERRL